MSPQVLQALLLTDRHCFRHPRIMAARLQRGHNVNPTVVTIKLLCHLLSVYCRYLQNAFRMFVSLFHMFRNVLRIAAIMWI